MRTLLFAVLLTACASHGAQRAETLAVRAACGDDGIAIFGFPRHEVQCTDQVASLGGGCYAVRRPDARDPWDLAVIECAADAPDGHVLCAEDRHAHLWQFVGDPLVTHVWVRMRDQPAVTDRALGRCADRFFAWAAMALPPRPAPSLSLFGWRDLRGFDLPEPPQVSVASPVDWATLRRLMPTGHLRITACPTPLGGVVVRGVPAPLASSLVPAIVDRLAAARLPGCRDIRLEFGGGYGA